MAKTILIAASIVVGFFGVLMAAWAIGGESAAGIVGLSLIGLYCIATILELTELLVRIPIYAIRAAACAFKWNGRCRICGRRAPGRNQALW